MRVKSLRVKARVKIYTRVFCMDFSWKSAILHAIYACVSAAMPMACTVSTDRDMAYSSKCETTVFEIQIQDIRTPSPPPPHPSRRLSASFWGKSNFALYSSPFQDHVICWTIYSKRTFVVFCSLLARNLFSSTAFHQDLS